MSLPSPRSEQAYCEVSAIEAGQIELPDDLILSNATPGAITTAPSLSFLIQHSKNGHKLLFDLGIRHDWQNYPPAVVENIRMCNRVEVTEDVVQSLAKGGLSPSDINIICLSHCHFDHVGDTTPFTQSEFVVGGDTKLLFNPGYPVNPDSTFAADLLPLGRTRYLSAEEEWQAVGPLPRGYDFYGDGSLYIIDAPGHLAGHLNVLVRTSADGGWLYLAGDSAHHWNLITGESDIAVQNHCCEHDDKALAEKHIERIKALWKMPRVRVLLAHDEPWYKVNKGGSQFWPGKISSL
ncbi:Metallo-hydrolase/oxidoreductase [Crucibulum laeve]|uniref:Metallo-hydrolase/oxidoreductase n=1 Tax=Crucibulum laeve TaxID=68775 RepID=A0A5C3M571_9AGAR|nr:Metallo-hydrolase/oxidoreductase [Crucibulum laeve]